MEVSILGQKYTIENLDRAEDETLISGDVGGYCDSTSRRIVIRNLEEDYGVDDKDCLAKRNLRHEIIHAFLYESGLGDNFEHKALGHEETTVDWIALQFPKIAKAFKETGCAE